MPSDYDDTPDARTIQPVRLVRRVYAHGLETLTAEDGQRMRDDLLRRLERAGLQGTDDAQVIHGCTSAILDLSVARDALRAVASMGREQDAVWAARGQGPTR